MIWIIGLGRECEDISLRAHKRVLSCDLVVAKTDRVAAFGYFRENQIACTALDEVFARSRSFDTLYKNLGDHVIRLAKGVENLCYCVEGSGADDRSAAYILKKCRDAVLLPACEKGSELLSLCASSSYALYAAYDFACGGYREVDHTVPLVVREIDSAFLASEVKLRLFESFGEETEVTVARSGEIRVLPLYELDRLGNYDYSVDVLLPAQPFTGRTRYNFADLVGIVRRLREPDGCPWDREQDHDSIRMNLIEEAYEALEAVECRDTDKMREEMGDLTLQPVFHAVMAEEYGEFSVADMLSELCGKLVFRHSHIFGEDRAEGGEEALRVWERNKNIEKKQNSLSEEIRDVPKNFPALLYAYKVQKRAGKGMDFANVEEAFDKLAEEIGELKAVESADAGRVEDEGGDLLFAAVNVLRLLGAQPELALRRAAGKFAARFIVLEEMLTEAGKSFKDVRAAELEELWQIAKQKTSSAR